MLHGFGAALREASLRAATALIRRYVSEFAIQVVLTICGFYCLVTPLLLWVAWTREIFLLILALGFASCAFFCIFALAARTPEFRRPDGARRTSLPGVETSLRKRTSRDNA